jgi:hypothetical protein
MFCSPKQHGKTQFRCSKNVSQKMFIRNDKISEIINDSDSNGGNCSELPDDTCEVNSSHPLEGNS